MTLFPPRSYNAKLTRHANPLSRGTLPIRLGHHRLISIRLSGLLAAASIGVFPTCLLHTYAGAAEAIHGGVETVRTAAQDSRGATFEITPRAARLDSVHTDTGDYVRVSMTGAPPAVEPGRPALPVLMVPVGVPDGMSAKLRVVSAGWEERSGLAPPLPVLKQRYVADDPKTGPVSEERYEPDPTIYSASGSYPKEAATLGEGGPLGGLWMMPAFVHPVRYDPGKKRYSVLKRMTLRVDFVPATARELKLRPVPRPGAEAAVWQHLQRSMLRNYDAARAFPKRAAPAGVRPRLAPARVGAGAGNPEFRISITTSGWSSLSYAALSGAGFPAGIPIAQIGIWERGYDDVGDSATSTPIPVVARDANANGVFDSGDAMTFYARNLRDRVGPLSIENRYTDANVYWLTWTGAPAAVPDSISGVISDPSPALPVSFQDTIHLEQNGYMLPWPNTNAGSPPENIEYFFWTNGTAPDEFQTTIPFVDANPDSAFRIQARYQGGPNWTHRLSISFEGSAGIDPLATNQTFFDHDVYLLDTGFTVPGSHIGGQNRYGHVGTGLPPGGSTYVQGSGAWLDWIEVTYSRRYIARANRLEFTSGAAAGVAELHVGGFTLPAIEVYDVTVPTAPLRVSGVGVNPSGGLYEAVFRTDASTGTRRFVALVAGAEIPLGGSSVHRDSPSGLGSPAPFPAGAFARSILIAPEEFLSPANRLADFRRNQGYVVELASIQDVYDEFNGGIKSARALRRYFQHAYDTWSPRPSFVVLLGDASMDYRHNLPESAVDWVPTYLAFETIGGPNGNELVANDPYYVLNLAGGASDTASVMPGFILGRVAASSAGELDQYVTKVIQYENFQPTDTWRGKQLLFSDDQYSSTIFFTAAYCFQPAEATFRIASQNMADAANSSASGTDIVSEFFDLAPLTDRLAAIWTPGTSCPIPDPLNTGCRKLLCVINALRSFGGGEDSFFTELNKGSLIFNVEAHANRYLIAHEQIYDPRDFGDLSRVANVGRPNFYMVWGCHANQFADGPAGDGIDSTDAIGEQWVMLPDRGSIGGLGSTAYELIDTNAAMNSFMADAFYTLVPPTPSGQPRQARWIMGEIVGQAYVRNANSGAFLQQAMNRTIHLLGDPMTRMDALPPRIFEVTADGIPIAENTPLTANATTDSVTLVAKVRDEAGLKKTDLVERSVPGGTITPVDPTLYSIAVSDTGRAHTLTARVRPHIGNYDFLVRSFDTNDREQDFALQVRSTARFLANGVVIVDGAFVEANAVLRAELTTPIPVTDDSLTLLLDGAPIANVTETAMDASGREWVLVTLPEAHGPGTHTLDVAVNGRTGIFQPVSFSIETSFRLRGVAVVSPRLMGTGCNGSVFQFELSAPAPKVELLLLTVSGRRVASLQWPGKTGFNVYCWDGRDSRGNETATGLYFYRLSAFDAAGHKVSQSGRMIRSR